MPFHVDFDEPCGGEFLAVQGFELDVVGKDFVFTGEVVFDTPPAVVDSPVHLGEAEFGRAGLVGEAVLMEVDGVPKSGLQAKLEGGVGLPGVDFLGMALEQASIDAEVGSDIVGGFPRVYEFAQPAGFRFAYALETPCTDVDEPLGRNNLGY